LANTFSAPTTRFRLVWLYLDSFNFTVALEFDRNGLAFTSDNRPADAVVHSEETRHSSSIHFQNFVARLQSHFFSRRIGHDVTNNRCHVRFAHGIADHPNYCCEHEREQQTEYDQHLDDDEDDATDVKNHCAG